MSSKDFFLLYLSKVVKIVFVVNPAIVGSQTVRLVGDVLHIKTHAVVKLSFKKLGKQTHKEMDMRERGTTKLYFDEEQHFCGHFKVLKLIISI